MNGVPSQTIFLQIHGFKTNLQLFSVPIDNSFAYESFYLKSLLFKEFKVMSVWLYCPGNKYMKVKEYEHTLLTSYTHD